MEKRVRPELLRLMLRRLGNVSPASSTEVTWLLASTRLLRHGYMAPSFRTSAQSRSWLSVMCSRCSVGQVVWDSDTEPYPFRHRKSSASLDDSRVRVESFHLFSFNKDTFSLTRACAALTCAPCPR